MAIGARAPPPGCVGQPSSLRRRRAGDHRRAAARVALGAAAPAAAARQVWPHARAARRRVPQPVDGQGPVRRHHAATRRGAAAPGAAVGVVVFSPTDVARLVSEGSDVILVRDETSPEDIDGMNLAKGF